MTMGEPACVRAAAVAASTSPAAATATSAIRLTLFSSLGRSGGDPPVLPALEQLLPTATDDVGGIRGPDRVRVCGAEASVVGEDLDVVEAVPAHAVEGAEDRRHSGDAVPGKDAIRPAARRVSPVAHVHADDEVRVLLDLLEEPRRVPQMPDVELDAERR